MSTGVERSTRPNINRPRADTDLVKMNEEELAALAHKAFLLGCLDAEKRSNPRNAYVVMDEIMPAGASWRNYHRIKFRQVYGAGFDMRRMTLNLPLLTKE